MAGLSGIQQNKNIDVETRSFLKMDFGKGQCSLYPAFISLFSHCRPDVCMHIYMCGGGCMGRPEVEVECLYHSVVILASTNLAKLVGPPALGSCPSLTPYSCGCRCMPAHLAF